MRLPTRARVGATTVTRPRSPKREHESAEGSRSTRGDVDLYARALDGSVSLQGRRIVDVGCGRGAFLQFLAARGARAIGFDVVHEDLRAFASSDGPPGGIRVVAADAHALPLGTASVAGATSFLVVHYLRDPLGAMSEIRRALTPSGWFILADRVTDADDVVRAEREVLERRRSATYRRLYTSAELRALCEAAGFDVVSEEPYEKRVPVSEWLRDVPPEERAHATAWLKSWVHGARPRTLRLEGGDVVIAETILRCRVRDAAG